MVAGCRQRKDAVSKETGAMLYAGYTGEAEAHQEVAASPAAVQF